MATTGNRYLRAACFRAALSGIGCNPIVREHYQHKRAAGKSSLNALGHSMRKVLSLV